jgi:hypothetical protein
MRNRAAVLGAGIVIGYFLGFRDARTHETTIAARAVAAVRSVMGPRPANDVDAVMDRLDNTARKK